MLRRTDRPSHEEMSVKHKGWLSQGAVISLRKPNGGDGWQWRFGKNEISVFEWNAMFDGTTFTEVFPDRA